MAWEDDIDAWLQEIAKEFETLSKVFLRAPRRTPPPVLGHIQDIQVTPPAPTIDKLTLPSSVIATLEAIDVNGNVTFAASGNTNYDVSGTNLIRTATGTLTANSVESVTVTATDNRGAAGSFGKAVTIRTYDIPLSIALSVAPGAGTNGGTINASAPLNTSVGTFVTTSTLGGPVAGPLSYAITNGNTKFAIGVDSNQLPALVRSATGTIVNGVPETVIVQVTDNSQNTTVHNTASKSFAITVTGSTATNPTRFTALDLPTPVIGVLWNRAGTDATTAAFPTILSDGFAGDWKVYSTDCPTIHNRTYSTLDAVRKDAVSCGYTAMTFQPGTVANPLDYNGPFTVKIHGFNQDNNGIIEYIGINGTGLTDGGVGPTGVNLWDIPKCQIMVQGTNSDAQIFDLRTGTHGQSRYRLNNIRFGVTREEEAASVVQIFNYPGATTSAQCILPTQARQGAGMALIQAAKQVCVTHCEQNGSVFNGMHSGEKLRAQRYNGILQVFDSVVRNNGDAGGLEHNVYLGDTRHAALGYNHFAYPDGHNIKFDNQQRFDVYENAINAYHLSYLKYTRTTALKVFKGTSTVYSGNSPVTVEMARRTVPSNPGPYTITTYGWYDDMDGPIFSANIAGAIMTVINVNYGTLADGLTLYGGTPGQPVANGTTIVNQLTGTAGSKGTYTVSIPQTVNNGTNGAKMVASGTVLKPSYVIGGTELTVITNGSPTAGQILRTLTSGVTSTDKDANTAVVTWTVNSADATKQIDIPGRAFGGLRGDTGGGGISIDNPNQDFAIWNNMFHGFSVSGSGTQFVYAQGRHQGGDLRHHKQPPYSWQDTSVANEIDLLSIQGTIQNDTDGLPQVTPPKTYFGTIGTPLPVSPSTTYKLVDCDFAYPDMFGNTGGVDIADKGPLGADQTTVYDIEVRCSDGYVHVTTMTLQTKVATKSGGSTTYTATLASSPPPQHVLNGDTRNPIVFKKSVTSGGLAAWDRPKMDTVEQRDWFDRTATDYYPYLITFSGDHSELDFSKQEPGVSGRKYGIPFGYVNNNLCIPLLQPDNLTRVTYKDCCLVQSLNVTYCTKFASSGSSYPLRMAFPPLYSSDGVAWADQAYAGNFDFRLFPHQVSSTTLGGPMFGSDGTGGVGINNSDMIRPNAIVMKENGLFDYHVPPAGQFSGYGNVGNNSASDDLYNTIEMFPDLRFIPQDNTTTVDANGCVKFTTADKTSFPVGIDRGLPIKVIGPWQATGGSFGAIYAGGLHSTRVDGCRIQTINGGTPAVNDIIQLECDTQFGTGEGVHNAALTTVAAVGGGIFDVIFTPGLPQIGGSDPYTGGTIPSGHEKGLSIWTANDTKGGRGVFMKPARTPLPSWWLDPVSGIPES